ncbi:hypothetical protein WME89_47595 [Sorangium sp. So ce321]|uniref:hypothetical protein n=1 Tax=Sorangium sp. So ce321 TaxID=3133300 RepID=UPI003F611B89
MAETWNEPGREPTEAGRRVGEVGSEAAGRRSDDALRALSDAYLETPSAEMRAAIRARMEMRAAIRARMEMRAAIRARIGRQRRERPRHDASGELELMGTMRRPGKVVW